MWLMEEDRLKVVLDQVQEVVMVWEVRRRKLADARAAGDTAVRQAEADLRHALAGMPLARWQSLSSGAARPRSALAARELHQAARSRQAVKAALDAVVAAEVLRDTQVRAAAAELAEVSRRLAGYGRLAERISGLRADHLRHMIRGSRSASGDAPSST